MKEEGRKHTHCPGCGVLNVPLVTRHAADCPRREKQLDAIATERGPGARSCPKCHRLLAAGAWCPKHGRP